jgi:hypothetical protein
MLVANRLERKTSLIAFESVLKETLQETVSSISLDFESLKVTIIGLDGKRSKTIQNALSVKPHSKSSIGSSFRRKSLALLQKGFRSS